MTSGQSERIVAYLLWLKQNVFVSNSYLFYFQVPFTSRFLVLPFHVVSLIFSICFWAGGAWVRPAGLPSVNTEGLMGMSWPGLTEGGLACGRAFQSIHHGLRFSKQSKERGETHGGSWQGNPIYLSQVTWGTSSMAVTKIPVIGSSGKSTRYRSFLHTQVDSFLQTLGLESGKRKRTRSQRISAIGCDHWEATQFFCVSPHCCGCVV